MKKKIVLILLVFGLFLISNDLIAQCPMCKMAAESNLKAGGTAGRGLNTGILYMLTAPYLFVGIMAYIWVRNRRKVAEDDAIQPNTQVFSEN